MAPYAASPHTGNARVNWLSMSCTTACPYPQLADPAQLADAAAPRIPANNLSMLVMLSQKNPDLLHQLGLTQQVRVYWCAMVPRCHAGRAQLALPVRRGA